MRRAAVLALLAALATLACTTLRPPPRLPGCPGALVDAAALPGGDFALRERLRVSGPDVDLALDLAVERRGDRLVLVAFDPLGARVFSAVQVGVEVEADSRLGRLLPIAPQTVLRDLHAARFAAAASDAERVTVERPGCAHRATFTRIEQRTLPPASGSSH